MSQSYEQPKPIFAVGGCVRNALVLSKRQYHSIVDDTISANWGEGNLIYVLVENGSECG